MWSERKRGTMLDDRADSNQTWRAPTSEVWQARRAAMFLRDMNERVEEAEIFVRPSSRPHSLTLRSNKSCDRLSRTHRSAAGQRLRTSDALQAEALMRQDAALENRTRWQYDLADRNAHLQFRQSMMALLARSPCSLCPSHAVRVLSSASRPSRCCVCRPSTLVRTTRAVLTDHAVRNPCAGRPGRRI